MARGELRIYLGAAPGVGKTYAMLQEGRRRRDRGTDVVAAYVETHGRRNTAAQIEDLEGFSHVWVVAHLHETLGWTPAVPTFLDDRTHGTFATRSPRRPNPIGLSLASVVSVGSSSVVVEGLDLLDGTPVLDLKPFVPLFDTPSTDVRAGWF